jgi:membrane-bound lytic murein transglycosylase MltF
VAKNMSMERMAETLASRKQLVSTVPTGFNKVKTTDTTGINCGSKYTKRYDADELFDQLSELVNPVYRAWYCKMFYKIGKDKVMQIASIAKADGKEPRKLFSLLLKQAGM